MEEKKLYVPRETYRYCKPDPTKFYGEITTYDFDGHTTMQQVSDAIARSERWNNVYKYNCNHKNYSW
jgi:hypothetical protein